MLINLSNHPLATWSDRQRQEAERQFGRVVDLPFPDIAPDTEVEAIVQLATKYVAMCLEQLEQEGRQAKGHAVHVMGEMTFVHQFVRLMSEQGVLCVASTTQRIVVSEGSDEKTSRFEFVQFRPYAVELF